MITLQHIADAVGCSRATVSRALAGHPRVAPATRRKVEQAARRLGYRPDPRLHALAARRWPHGRRSGQAVIVYAVDEYTVASTSKLAEGRRRAEALGYRLEVLRLDQLDEPAAVQANLLQRGVHGLVLDLHVPDRLPDFDWDRFCIVLLGEELPHLSFHRVGTDWRQVMRLALDHAPGDAGRRIGFVLRPLIGRELYRNLLAEMLTAAWNAEPSASGWQALFAPPDEDAEARFHHWLDGYQPGTLICSDETPRRWLERSGRPRRRRPDVINLIRGDRAESRPPGPGVDIRRGHRLCVAIDLLHDLLRLDQRGPSDDPRTILCKGAWRDGVAPC
jgi:DNA-binding LacI/PurR family transcriptional regulator